MSAAATGSESRSPPKSASAGFPRPIATRLLHRHEADLSDDRLSLLAKREIDKCLRLTRGSPFV